MFLQKKVLYRIELYNISRHKLNDLSFYGREKKLKAFISNASDNFISINRRIICCDSLGGLLVKLRGNIRKVCVLIISIYGLLSSIVRYFM